MEQNQMRKWQGKVYATVTSKNADQIWSFFKDFFNLHKWFPTLKTCYGVHGTNGEVGCIRYCAGFSIPSTDSSSAHGEDNTTVSWCKERLAAIDDVERSMSYELLEGNIGFESYKATFKIVPLNEADDGCVIEWLFALDPIEGRRLEDVSEKYEKGLLAMAKKMEDALDEDN